MDRTEREGGATMAGELAIEAEGLAKRFGQTRAVDGVDLRVRAGTVYGVLGPNGAGKTTTIRILATLLRPDGGTARVFGHDVVRRPNEVRRRVSLTGQLASVDEDLTAFENLVLFGRLLGLGTARARARASELLDAFDLAEASDRLTKHLSGGMRRRLDIAAGLITPVDLLFLDEPTTGLDPRSRARVWDIVRALVRGGATVLLTTQYLDEADQLADRIAVIDHGRVIAEGTSAELKAATGPGTLRVRLADTAAVDAAGRALARLVRAAPTSDGDAAELIVQVADPAVAARAVADLWDDGFSIADFALARPSLDEVFLTLTGRPAADGSNRKEEVA
jgi:ABC-2 type transport system ATP-binding protein